jgi:hypothetical protein
MSRNPEQNFIRSKLAIKHDALLDEYSVYTTTHGSMVFRWYKCTKESFEWYKTQFNLTPMVVNQPNKFNGALL